MIRHNRSLFLIAWKCCLPFINFDEVGSWLSICNIRAWELILERALPICDGKCAANRGRSRSLLDNFGPSTRSSTSGRTCGNVGGSLFNGFLTAPAYKADALFTAKTVDALVAASKELSTLYSTANVLMFKTNVRLVRLAFLQISEAALTSDISVCKYADTARYPYIIYGSHRSYQPSQWYLYHHD